MISVSVIMPVYNAEKYLAMAIESVLNQSFEDFELILVDDGSKDKSLSFCEKYAAKDKRIKVVHQENKGICAARNRGLALASGEYVSFIDNDDVYLPDLLEENYRLAKKYKADFLKYGNRYIKHRKFSTDNICSTGEIEEQKVWVISQSELAKSYQQINDEDWLIYVWDGLFRTAWIKANEVTFDTVFKAGHEDRVFCLQLYEKASCIVVNPKVYYIHVVYKASTSRVFSAARIGDTERLLKYEQQLFDALRIKDIYPLYWQERVMTYIILICSILRKPEARVSLLEMQEILRELKSKYYIENTQSVGVARYKKRFKNKAYAYLFENNHIKALSVVLMLDRAVKQILKKII